MSAYISWWRAFRGKIQGGFMVAIGLLLVAASQYFASRWLKLALAAGTLFILAGSVALFVASSRRPGGQG